MITPMLRPDLFGGLATHAGDALFEVCYARDFAPCGARAPRPLRRVVRAVLGGLPLGPAGALGSPNDALLVNTYAMAAAYSANDDGTVDLPFDVETGEPIPEVWERWLEWDPVLRARGPEVRRGAAQHARDLDRLRARSDEYYLDLGAAAFRREVVDAGVPDERVHFELFDGHARRLTWRYPLSLDFLVERLSITL